MKIQYQRKPQVKPESAANALKYQFRASDAEAAFSPRMIIFECLRRVRKNRIMPENRIFLNKLLDNKKVPYFISE